MSASTIDSVVPARGREGARASARPRPAWAGLRQLGPVLRAVLLAAPVAGAGVFNVWTHVAAVRLGYALTEAAEQNKTLNEQNKGLRVEVAALKAPDRLEHLARETYGLQPPTPAQVIRVQGTGR